MQPHPARPDALTAAWLREALAAAGDPRATLADEVRVERIGVGFGLDGEIARVTLLGARGASATVVAKWCTAKAGANEARFYMEVAPHLAIAVPRMIAAHVGDTEALLLLDDLAPARQGDTLVGATPEEASRVFDAIASFQAQHWGLGDRAPLVGLPRWGGDPATMAQRTREQVPRFLARQVHRLSRAMAAAVERVPDELPQAYALLATAPTTLVHGDLHLDNVFFRADGTPIVIDWASACRGPGVVDVVRFLLEGLTLTARRALESRLRAAYLAHLDRSGIRYAAVELDEHALAALRVMLAAAMRFKDDGAPGAPARLGPIIDALAANVIGAYEDHVLRR